MLALQAAENSSQQAFCVLAAVLKGHDFSRAKSAQE